MLHHPGLWCAHFYAAASLGYKVSVMRPDGYAIDTANWTPEVMTPLLPAAWSWTEWVDDPQALLAWFADHSAPPLITYHCLARINGRAQRAIISLERVWAGDAWVCVGSIVPAAMPRRQLASAPPSR